MNKKILITAGTVYGPLDANKLVGNRVRGIWAVEFSRFLLEREYLVTLLVPDTMNKSLDLPYKNLDIIYHSGFEDYHAKCRARAESHDAAIMAAAVVNWIPLSPYPGKMPTAGYKEGDVINVPFYLAPHVIDDMKKINPKLTLIGCKMLVNAPEEELIEAAYGVLLKARCNAVIANDMGKGLRRKLLVHQDKTVIEFNDDFHAFYETLVSHIEDEHYRTVCTPDEVKMEDTTFEAVLRKHGEGFIARQNDSDLVFGSLYVPMIPNQIRGTLSSREKTGSNLKPVWLDKVEDRTVYLLGNEKATLNAPLLVRVSQKHPEARAILHQHRQLPGVPTVPYAPPGTVRDNEREIPGPVFNIEGHGFIACLDNTLKIWDGIET